MKSVRIWMFFLKDILEKASFFIAVISAFSCLICGAIAYALFKDNKVFSPYIVMVIVALLTGILNWLCWRNRTKSLIIEDE